jgi:hypothetical protein
MQCNAMQCNAMQCNAMQCNAMNLSSYHMRWCINQQYTTSVECCGTPVPPPRHSVSPSCHPPTHPPSYPHAHDTLSHVPIPCILQPFIGRSPCTWFYIYLSTFPWPRTASFKAMLCSTLTMKLKRKRWLIAVRLAVVRLRLPRSSGLGLNWFVG